ncbi:alpha/beta fold hydrolase [Novosphingobium fuchskuhlense]|uniref:alpha/beta fold hydrolase n=1 Tax=Novosphingobium fuchskuhlense TaxID=1117702 RepID=UPI0009E7A2BE|nr:alpha/beta hydrolase [Novosphingobium fuchskuhlense]
MIRHALAVAALAFAAPAEARPAPAIAFPAHFDPIGTPVVSLKTSEGRTVHYTDTGEAGWRTMLFIGGVGTSARAPELVAFLDTLRRQLKVRIIAVERNGLGDTAFDPAWSFADYTSEVRQVLGHLGVDKFAVVAISGGGAYAGHIAAAMPERITSWHMLAAIAAAPAESPVCKAEPAALEAMLGKQVGAPRVFWAMPPDGVAAKVSGFIDRAADEGAHAYFIAGQQGDARAVAREYHRFCDAPAPVTAFPAPAFFYYGEADPLVPPAQGEYWAGKVAGKVTFRRYPGEGHDVQYRHWDQLLLDVAGHGGETLACMKGRARLLPGLVEPARLPKGTTLGICAWSAARAKQP